MTYEPSYTHQLDLLVAEFNERSKIGNLDKVMELQWDPAYPEYNGFTHTLHITVNKVLIFKDSRILYNPQTMDMEVPIVREMMANNAIKDLFMLGAMNTYHHILERRAHEFGMVGKQKPLEFTFRDVDGVEHKATITLAEWQNLMKFRNL
jgi:hypothetical protein